MIGTVLGLVAVALLALVLLSTTLHSGGNSDTGASKPPGVIQADDLVAQQSLSTALTAVDTAATAAGGYGALDVATLTASDPSVSYVDGPTTGGSMVSIAVTPGGNGSPVGAGTPGGGPAGSAISGAEAAGSSSATGTGGSGGSGTVTLAARSSSGTCWLVWKGAGTATWYGAQTGLASCTAPALTSAPTPGPVSASSIGWQMGAFPTA